MPHHVACAAWDGHRGRCILCRRIGPDRRHRPQAERPARIRTDACAGRSRVGINAVKKAGSRRETLVRRSPAFLCRARVWELLRNEFRNIRYGIDKAPSSSMGQPPNPKPSKPILEQRLSACRRANLDPRRPGQNGKQQRRAPSSRRCSSWRSNSALHRAAHCTVKFHTLALHGNVGIRMRAVVQTKQDVRTELKLFPNALLRRELLLRAPAFGAIGEAVLAYSASFRIVRNEAVHLESAGNQKQVDETSS